MDISVIYSVFAYTLMQIKMKLLDPSLVLLIFVIILIICILGKYHWSRRHLYLFAAQLSGPPALPLIGNGLEVLCKKEDLLDAIMKMTEPYSSPLKVWLGPRLVIFIKDPDQLQTILQSSKMSTKSYFYRFLEPFLGQGLFTSSGNIHKKHRKLLQPLFSQKVLTGYSHLFQKHANKFVNNIRHHVNESEFDLLLYLHSSAFEATMDILLEDKNDHSIDYKDIPQIIRRCYNLFFTRITNVLLHFDIIYKKTLYFKEQNKIIQSATVMIGELMNTRVAEILKRLQDKVFKKSEARTPSMLEMIIEMVVENPNCFTEKDCVDHMMTFVATSQDTQSSIVGFTCMMLGIHPSIQDRVLKEIKEVIGSRTELDLTDVSRLKYLEMCIKESMRLFPVAPFIFRDTVDEFKLGKYVIPKDVTVGIGIYNIHRDPKYWERPEEYYPEHFTATAVSQRHPYAFLPFSAGPRKCIAQQYSYTNMKIFIATILLNYKLECEHSLKDIKLMTDVSIRPVDGYLIKIKPRK